MSGTETGYLAIFFVISAVLGCVLAVDAKSMGFPNIFVMVLGLATAFLAVFTVPAYILYRIVNWIDPQNRGLAGATLVIYTLLASGVGYLIYFNVFRK